LGIVFRQSAKNAIVTVCGAVLGAVVIWLSTKYTTKQQLGFTRNMTNYAISLSQMLMLGVNSTLCVYIYRYAEQELKRKALIALSFIVPGIAVTVFTIVIFLIKPWLLHHFQPEDIPFMNRYFTWLPVYTALFIYTTLLEQYLGTQFKVAISAFMREVLLRIASILLIVLYGFGYISFDVLFIGSVLIYFLPLVIFLWLAFRLEQFGLSLQFKSFPRSEYKEMIHFSWYHFLLSMVFLFMVYMDSLLLPFYDHKGFVALAVYSIAVYLSSLLQIPYRSVTPASFAVLAKAFADNDI